MRATGLDEGRLRKDSVLLQAEVFAGSPQWDVQLTSARHSCASSHRHKGVPHALLVEERRGQREGALGSRPKCPYLSWDYELGGSHHFGCLCKPSQSITHIVTSRHLPGLKLPAKLRILATRSRAWEAKGSQSLLRWQSSSDTAFGFEFAMGASEQTETDVSSHARIGQGVHKDKP